MINRQLTQNAVFKSPAILHLGGMSTHADSKRLKARALRDIRLNRRISQDAVATAIDVTKASLSAWETGKTRATDENLENYREYLGVTEDELDEIIDSLPELQPVEPVRPQAPRGLGEGLVAMEVDDEDMWPWVGQGQTVYYRWGAKPARGQACVVALKDSRMFVRIYEKSDADKIFLRRLNPDKLETYQWDEFKGMHRIELRSA